MNKQQIVIKAKPKHLMSVCLLLAVSMCLGLNGCTDSSQTDTNSQSPKIETESLSFEQQMEQKERKRNETLMRIAYDAYSEEAQNFSYTPESGGSDTITIHGIHELTEEEMDLLNLSGNCVFVILDKAIGYIDEEKKYYETPDLKCVIIGIDGVNGFAFNTGNQYIIDMKNPDAPIYDCYYITNTQEWLHEPTYYIPYEWAVANGYAERKTHYSVSPKNDSTVFPNISSS